MKSCVGLRMAAAILAAAAVFGGPAGAIEVLDPGYVVETYVTFECANYWPATGLAFDPAGNIYITHAMSDGGGKNGSIYRVDCDRNVVSWITGITRPLYITWTGGTSYGEYLYVAEGFGNTVWSNGGITRIGLDGTVTPFSGSGLNRPTSIEVDRTGKYGGYMFVGNGSLDNIKKLSSNGYIQPFSDFPYDISGAPSGIVFDRNGNYGGLMYVGVYTATKQAWSGLFSLDGGGKPTRFAPEINSVDSLVFDVTADGSFGGCLYAVGFTGADPKWALYRILPDGSIEKFSVSSNQIKKIGLGPDGYLYVVESNWNDSTATVSRIMPRNPLLFKLEEAIREKEKAREMVESALVKERQVLEALNEILHSGDPGELRWMDIIGAKVNIYLSLLQEYSVKHHLNKSIERLKEAWMILAGADEFPGGAGEVKEGILRRADINGDGVIDGKDFAILSRYWLKKYDR